LKGFKKDHGNFVKRVEEFVMPSFKLNNDQIEEIPVVSNEPFDLVKQLSLLMDKKISDAYIIVGDTFALMNSEIDELKKRQKHHRQHLFIRS